MMNKFNTFLKVISALAAVVGAVYIVATYGDKIVAWAKRLLGCDSTPIATFHYTTDEVKKESQPAAEAPAAEAPAAEAPAAEEKAEEAAPVTEETAEAPAAAEAEEAAAPEAPVVEEGTPVADEEDFEG